MRTHERRSESAARFVSTERRSAVVTFRHAVGSSQLTIELNAATEKPKRADEHGGTLPPHGASPGLRCIATLRRSCCAQCQDSLISPSKRASPSWGIERSLGTEAVAQTGSVRRAQVHSGMAPNFIESRREQGFLLPPDVRGLLPADHLARFLIDAVAEMDVAAFYAAYRADGHGRAAYEPSLIVAPVL
jgi:hypothetical protein